MLLFQPAAIEGRGAKKMPVRFVVSTDLPKEVKHGDAVIRVLQC